MSQSSVCAHHTPATGERRESHRANQVYAFTTHQAIGGEEERVIEPIKCMRSPTHQLQVERRESHRDNQVYALTTHQLQVERRERHRDNQVDGNLDGSKITDFSFIYLFRKEHVP